MHHEIFSSSKLVNFFLSEGGPSLAHSKNINFTGRECQNFEREWEEVQGHSGENVSFSQSTPDFPNFIWVVIHFIAVIYCILNILNLTNSFRED